MKELTEPELGAAEDQASAAELELASALAESEADAVEVAFTVRDLRARLEDEVRKGATGLDDVLADLRQVVPPVVPIDRHEARVLEARADALRARMWVVAAMRDDLKRFSFELGDAVRVAELAREALARMQEEARSPTSRRFERIRTVTADLVAKREADRPAPPRRQQPRIRIDAQIDLHTPSNFFAGFSENISDGGVFVVTDDDIPIGTEVDLAFTLPDGMEIRGRGHVRWHRGETSDAPRGLGVQFVNLSGAARDAVQNFVLMRSPIFHPE